MNLNAKIALQSIKKALHKRVWRCSINIYVICSSFDSKVGWLVALRIYVTSAIFQPNRNLEAGNDQSLKS